MLKKHKMSLALAAIMLATSANLQADNTPAPTQQQQNVVGFLGIGIDRVPTSVKAHYPDGVDSATGLIVTQFADESPAADHGIKLHDVLLNYDDQPLVDPRKLIEAIRQDKPGRTVNLKVLRQGEVLTLPIVMGQQKVQRAVQPPMPQLRPSMPPMAGYPQPGYGGQFPPSQPYAVQPNPYGAPSAVAPTRPVVPPPATANTAPPVAGVMPASPPGQNFNGLAIRRIGDDIYDASIGFTGPDGSAQRRSYKGTREQILQQIMNARDLPPAERNQLMFAVKPKQKKSSGWGGMPFGGDNKMFNPSKMFKGWGW